MHIPETCFQLADADSCARTSGSLILLVLLVVLVMYGAYGRTSVLSHDIQYLSDPPTLLSGKSYA